MLGLRRDGDDRVVGSVVEFLFATVRFADRLDLIRAVVRYLAHHSGVPALLVGAVLVAVGWRLLKWSARFLVELAVIAAVLVVLTELGWIRW